uniref:Uncharacterized protein n=1 Tax=Chaetoceros debilis TaxID=122233 RepID=A0A7S3QK96_9STRA
MISKAIRSTAGQTSEALSRPYSRYEDISCSSSENTTEHHRVELQWMRPHPALLFQASEQKDGEVPIDLCSKIAVEASELVNCYTKRKKLKRKRSETEIDAKLSGGVVLPTSNVSNYMNLMCLPRVKVDLTQLMDPPLLSQWIPGQDISIDYGKDNSTNTQYASLKGGEDEHDQDTKSSKSESEGASIKEDTKAFLLQIMQNPNEYKIVDQPSIKIKHNLLKMSSHDWLKVLPSREFKCRTMDCFNPLSISTIILRLASICPSQAMGIHLLSVISVLCCDESKVDSQKMEVKSTSCIEDISISLVHTCNLGGLSRNGFCCYLNRLKNNDFGIHLKRRISKEYFSCQNK